MGMFRKLALFSFLAACIWPHKCYGAIAGHFSLNLNDISPVAARNFTDGYWMGGVELPVWMLNDTNANKPILYVAPEYLHGINGYNESAGFVLGTRVLDIGLLSKSLRDQGLVTSPPPWYEKAADAVSIELGGGYNFNPEYKYIKPWFATIGAVIKLPLGPGSVL